MKSLPRNLLPLTLFGIAITSLFSVQPAQAYTATLAQVGSNVVVTGSGAINLTGLTFERSGTLAPNAIFAEFGGLQTGGGPPNSPIDQYSGMTGPTSFGSGNIFFADTFSGDFVGILGFNGIIDVPQGYVSGALSNSMTFNNATFASLGVTPGTYVWTWGTRLENQNQNQSFTLTIESVGVPDGGSTVSLLGFGLLGLATLRRRLGC